MVAAYILNQLPPNRCLALRLIQVNTAALSRWTTAVTTAQSGCYSSTNAAAEKLLHDLYDNLTVCWWHVCDQNQSFMVNIHRYLCTIYQHIDELKLKMCFYKSWPLITKTWWVDLYVWVKMVARFFFFIRAILPAVGNPRTNVSKWKLKQSTWLHCNKTISHLWRSEYV